MSQANVEIVRAVIAAYRREDQATLRKLTAPDIAVSTRPDQPDPWQRHGVAAIEQVGAEWVEAWSDHTFEPTSFTESGDFVLVSMHESGRGRSSGVQIETDAMFVFTVSDGKVVRMQVFGSKDEALKAVGLEE